ncbi:ribonuclease inhibitor [Dyadobacter flavalbus]|uniref:Ribonuclease inhibitor n=1 Tax=Dyadobacter flavalbus TaxID=2579942 RepID=A0A5M8R1C0_9BACT|nr:c-type cytochrome domain-containing protein [Dyadobacter flavalbus]KAA6441388.1 ribonuclease inhibitor [Dyadobacter flavalbus]
MPYPFLQASGWAIFIGRFHPVFVHLPIGFIILAALLEIGRRTGKVNISQSVISFILLLSAIGATLACIAGYLLSLGGGYDEELLNNHKWQGIGVAAFAWIAWLVKSELFTRFVPLLTKIYIPAFAISLLLTMTAGHDGGSLTHGEDYLTQYMPAPLRNIAGLPPAKEQIVEMKPITNIQEAVVYKDIVQPILEMRCVQCHNASKQKGDLRMDQLALLLKGGESGPAFIAGKSAESDMIKRCLLPENDDEHMPPKGKPQLTNEQIALLSWWIDQGAAAEKKVAELKATEEVKKALASLGSGQGSGNEATSTSMILNVKVPAARETDMEALRKAGLIVNAVSQDLNLLEVSAVNAPNFNDKQVALLSNVSEQIAWLKLGKTKISDAGLKIIANFRNLSKLHLEHTAVTDAGLKELKNLPSLEYLNLVDTKISDAGLENIASKKGLRSVYVWQSAVTDSAVSRVSKHHPDLLIVNGMNEAAISKFLKSGDTTALKATAEVR